MDFVNIREIILNARQPIVLKNHQIPWKCFEMSLEQWSTKFDKNSGEAKGFLRFESSSLKGPNVPQWESDRKKVIFSCRDFVRSSSVSAGNKLNTFFESNWAALSYKNISEMPEPCREGINFDLFGFPNVGDDCTFWLSSKGAHTPCHYDTYGCNIVVQVYGRKLWYLFPNEARFTPVRIPYEESSVYCSENFYSPDNLHQFRHVSNECHLVVLEPGDVLVVPRNWWHYVENLETSLSINAWIPVELDTQAQLEECIVKLLVEKFAKTAPRNEKRQILNPNQLAQLTSEKKILQILNFLAKQATDPQLGPKLAGRKYPYQYLDPKDFDTLAKEFPTPVQCVEKITEEEFWDRINSNRARNDSTLVTEELLSSDLVKQILINSICHPNVIKQIKELFLQKYETLDANNGPGADGVHQENGKVENDPEVIVVDVEPEGVVQDADVGDVAAVVNGPKPEPTEPAPEAAAI